MEWTVTLSFAKLKVQVNRLGQDYNIVLQGGDKPHIGCTVLSVPRPSLTGDGSISATSSTLNVTGHKDDILCLYLAEEVCRIKNAVTVCSGGFHTDGITEKQIKEVQQAVKKIGADLIEIREKEE